MSNEKTPPGESPPFHQDPVSAMYEERTEWILRTELTVRIPDHLKRFIDSQVHSGRYEDADHYIAALVQADQKSSS